MSETPSHTPAAERDPSARFSLFAGGPCHALCLRLGLTTPTLGRIGRRSALLVGMTWLPLPVLALAERVLWRGRVAVPLATDIDVHVQFLIALPLLLLAEVHAHGRLQNGIREFVHRDIVCGAERARFEEIVRSTQCWRDAWAGELSVVGFVFLVSRPFWLDHLTLGVGSWYATDGHAGAALTLAGRWLAWVSVPMFQFLSYRWLYRLLLWITILIRIARLELRLIPTHPDRAGGLGFLGSASIGFATLLGSLGVLLAAMIANFIFFERGKLFDYEFEVAGFVLVSLSLVLGPLGAFTPKLIQVKELGLREYGSLAQRYMRGFDTKWLRGGGGEPAELVGSGDIQSLNDMAGSYDVIRSMRPVPFNLEHVVALVISMVAPCLALVPTVLPLDELLRRLIGILL